MPIHRIGAADAFDTLKANPFSDWPRRDDPANRFAHIADPSFEPRFRLEPGQRIFTIGSCFARNIEKSLAERGFDVPTLSIGLREGEWKPANPAGILNNYVPPAIAPQIRWAFGMDAFDVERHAVEVRPGRFLELHVPVTFRPVPREVVLRRREEIGRVYRALADSHVVVITLGMVEAWFDTRSGLYINCTPLRGMIEADPARFELHVLDYADVTAALAELVALLGQVCPRDHRIILTVSPVPLHATFRAADVAVANSYSKSVLRAAVEPFVMGHDHIEYFPSYESVLLTDRSTAFVDDQMHVHASVVRFNVDRMLNRYVRNAEESVADTIARAREEARAGLFGAGLKRLQQAWTRLPDNAELAVALAEAQLRAGNGAGAEALLLAHLAKHETNAARTLLARHYNEQGRHEEAALQAEQASAQGKARLHASLQRIVAYYHLGRLEEGLALLNKIAYPLERRSLVVYWKARFCARLGRTAEAEEHFRVCNDLAEETRYRVAYAEFLAGQQRWPEADDWIEKALLQSPDDPGALRLRVESRKRGLQRGGAGANGQRSLFQRAVQALPFGRSR